MLARMTTSTASSKATEDVTRTIPRLNQLLGSISSVSCLGCDPRRRRTSAHFFCSSVICQLAVEWSAEAILACAHMPTAMMLYDCAHLTYSDLARSRSFQMQMTIDAGQPRVKPAEACCYQIDMVDNVEDSA